jgi:hypothetical protein
MNLTNIEQNIEFCIGFTKFDFNQGLTNLNLKKVSPIWNLMKGYPNLI